MKKLYVGEILEKIETEQEVEIFGWIRSKRNFGGVIFLDLVDSTGCIQLVASKDADPSILSKMQETVPESSVRAKGVIKYSKYGRKEIRMNYIETIGSVTLKISPRPRGSFDIFEQRFTDLVLSKRHLYMRNEKLRAVMRFRHLFTGILHDWFRHQGFIEFNAPVLTQLPLYDDDSAMELEFFDSKVFLTQCVAFYLESAVSAFERLYNIGPSFRAEKSTGKRHLAEYWHVKAEIAFADLEDIISFAEEMFSYIVQRIANEARDELQTLEVIISVDKLTRIPYPRITYDEALKRLKAKGFEPEWGESLSDNEQGILSLAFDSPFWISGLPRIIEPFPYAIEPSDPRITKTADLIAPEGFGELLGVAEKIWRPDELLERMKEKGKDKDERYNWYYELRQFGSVPHSGFGMGVERTIRWLLRLNHVRDAIPFPRLFDRSVYP